MPIRRNYVLQPFLAHIEKSRSQATTHQRNGNYFAAVATSLFT